MQKVEYQALTATLLDKLTRDHRVIGLVALGSMAEQDYLPDRWSDHDFFVVVKSGEQEAFRVDLSWLPYFEEIVFSYRETAHGLKLVYASGHLLEFAVFDTAELQLAKVNRFRVLLDRGNIIQQLKEIQKATTRSNQESLSDDTYLFGQFLTNLLVGTGRYNRGEKLSGHQFVKSSALKYLITLLEKYLPSPSLAVLDNLDPLRRFEIPFPSLGQELNNILQKDTSLAAREMLQLAQRELESHLQNYPALAVEVVLNQLSSNNHSVG